MNRYIPLISQINTLLRKTALVLGFSLLSLSMLNIASVQAQSPAATDAARNFPEKSRIGTVVFGTAPHARVDGTSVRTAPGLRVFDQQNRLVHAHQIQGEKLKVRYLIEPATGFLQTVWILAPHELAQKR